MTADNADRAGDSVLGTLLRFYDPKLVTIVEAKNVEFWRDRQRVVWRAVLALHAQGSHVDPLTVKVFLERHGFLERAGGEAFLALLEMSAVPSALKDHAALVARSGRKTRRQRQIAALASANDREADEDEIAELYVTLGREIELPQAPLRAIDGGKAA